MTRRLPAFFLLISMFLLLCAAGAAAEPQVRYIQIPILAETTLAEFQGELAWSGQTSPSYDSRGKYHPQCSYLYMSAVTPFHPRPVASSEPGFFIIQVHLSRHWVVWEDQGQSPDWSIWAMNRQTGTTMLVDSSATTGRAPHPQDFPLLSLSGDTVAWAPAVCPRNDCVQGWGEETWISAVRVRQLPDGQVETVASSAAPCHLWWPSLATHILVWEQIGTCAGHTGSDIVLYDRTAHSTALLTTDHRSLTPTTDGPYVAWNQGRPGSGQGTIMLLHRKTGKVQSVSRLSVTGGCTQGTSPPFVCDVEPVLTGSALAWWANASREIAAMSLKTGRYYVLQHDAGDLVSGHIGPSAGHEVIWSAAKGVPTQGGHNYIGLASVP